MDLLQSQLNWLSISKYILIMFVYFSLPTLQSSYWCTMDAVEVDPLVPQLTKDLRDIEEICSASLSKFKIRYISLNS